MELSLWRGDTRLGALHLQQQTPTHLVGVLLPCVDAAALPGVMQSWFIVGATRPVLQEPIAPLHAAERVTPRPPTHPTHVALTPLSAEEARGVPLAQQLTLRHVSVERPLETPFLTLRAIQVPDGAGAAEREGLPPTAVRDGWLWMVTAMLASTDAPWQPRHGPRLSPRPHAEETSARWSSE